MFKVLETVLLCLAVVSIFNMFNNSVPVIVGYSRLQEFLKLENLVAEVKKKLNVEKDYEILIELENLKKYESYSWTT